MKYRLPVTLGFAALLLAAPCAAITLVSINVDGDMTDWTGVFIDPENAVTDAGEFSGDPDNPGADRDLRAFAMTWDDANLYFWWRRTLSGSNSVAFFVYIDLNFDGMMSSTDMVAWYRFSGGSFQTSELYYYDDGGSPDPITGDGVDMPGSMGALISAVLPGAGAASGIQLEGSVAWADLGVAPGSPLNFHISAGSNNKSEDNMEAFDSLFSRIDFQSDAKASAAPGTAVWLPHTVRNDGNAPDIFDVMVQSTQPWDHALYTDPDGDGDPSDGELMALDANGDGDYDDPFDTPPPPAHDADGDGVADTGPLAPGQAASLVLVVTPPAGTANGVLNDILLWARSANVPSKQRTNQDTVTAGTVVIHPDRSVPSPAGEDVDFAHEACDWTQQAEVVELATSSLLGWSATLYSDPDGDGDPADGQPLADNTGDTLPDLALPPEGCVSFVARVSVPPAALPGEQDTLQIMASAPVLGVSDELFDVTTVTAEVEVDPDQTEDSPVGGTIFYPHVLTNALPRDEVYDLQAVSSLGWTTTIFPDADGDGVPDDEVPITDTGPVARSGGTFSFVVRVQVPGTTVHADIDPLEVRATAQGDPAIQAVATDTTIVRNLLTFSDPLFARPASTFLTACANVYAEGSGLAPNSDFRFVWSDPEPNGGDERVTGIREPDADGRVDDVYGLTSADLDGTWTVRIQVRSGSNWDPLTVGGGRTFDVVPGGGTIDSLTSGKRGFFILGESLAVNTLLTNPTQIDFAGTSIRYVVFQDGNGDGLPTVGEQFIMPDGNPFLWWPGAFTAWTSPVDVLRGEEFRDFWRVTNIQFPVGGPWTISAEWLMDCGDVVHAVTTGIYVCAALPAADAGPDGPVCRGVPTSLGTPALPDHSYRWFPGDDLDDPDLAEPFVLLQQDRDYTLVVVEDATGCSNTDTLSLFVVDPPVPDILPDAPVMNMGGMVTLDAGSGVIHLWETDPPGEPGDGADTRTIDVSPSQDTIYTATVWDANLCSGQAQETVTVLPTPPEPLVDASSGTVCLGEEVTLDAGVITATYLWSTDPPGQPGDGATTQVIQVAPSETTIYTVLVEDGFQQQGSDQATVTILTTTPGSVGNTLRVGRDDRDLIFVWNQVPDAWTYNLYRSDRSDYASPVPLGNSGGPPVFRDAGAVDGVKLYLYQAHGMACFEGPR